MMRGKSLTFLLAMIVLGAALLSTSVAHAQYTAKDWPDGPSTVSYTHLTLPTIYSV